MEITSGRFLSPFRRVNPSMEYPLPDNEEERLAVLNRLERTRPAPVEALERVVRMARRIFVVSRAAVSLVGQEHQRVKAAEGWNVERVDRSHSFDAHAILDDEVTVVENVIHDDRFTDNPLVTEAPGIHFYAGAPLLFDEGVRVGTVSIADEAPRSFSERDRQLLGTLADLVVDLMSGQTGGPSSVSVPKGPGRMATMAEASASASGEPSSPGRGVPSEEVEAGKPSDPDRQIEQLRHEVFHDTLTGLPNRAALQEIVQRMIEGDESVLNALLYLDLDRFKLVNDSLGHSRGDQLLREVAGILQEAVREQDLVARIGGDEFAVCLPDVRSAEEVHQIANRIDQALNRPLELRERVVYTPASIGVVVGLSTYDTVEEVLRDADTAMYEAKGKVHQPFVMYEPSMTRRVEKRLSLDTEVRQAVERKEFVPFFHPIVNLEDGSLKGVEVLARWMHPERGILSPSVFLSVTEVTGLIIPIGHQVLERACRVAGRLHDKHGDGFRFSLNANFSRVEFFRSETHSLLTRIFDNYDVRPSNFTMEISERTVEGITRKDESAIYDLKDLGVEIVLDDFGTGFSSLQSLRRLPVDGLKIDKELLEGTEHGDWDRDLVDLVITMGHTLEKSVTAEGIETTDQLDALRESGCTYGQGFLFATPVSAQELESLIDDAPWMQYWKSGAGGGA